MNKYKTYTADDEESNCNACDNLNRGDDFCEGCCGPEHGWAGYRRTEVARYD